MKDRGYTEYEIGGFVFRLGDPELIFRYEGDQVFCRVEQTFRTVMVPKTERSDVPRALPEGSNPEIPTGPAGGPHG